MAWSTKGSKGNILLFLCSFYKQKVWMALQWAQANSILKCVASISMGSFRLNALLGILPFWYAPSELGVRGMFEYMIWWCSLSVHPLGGFFILLGLGSFLFVPFLDALFYWQLISFCHALICSSKIWKSKNLQL